jgi:hypothetical protein
MIRYELDFVPADAEYASYLDSMECPENLTQDLVAVKLSNGVFIYVDWLPEHDPAGSYHLTVAIYSDEYEEKELFTIAYKTFDEMLEGLKEALKDYNESWIFSSESTIEQYCNEKEYENNWLVPSTNIWNDAGKYALDLLKSEPVNTSSKFVFA